MQASICTSSRSSMRATGTPICIVVITVFTRDARSGTGTPPRRSPPDAVEPQLDLGDDAERAFRADHQRVRS
jgi:hypothetical protein